MVGITTLNNFTDVITLSSNTSYYHSTDEEDLCSNCPGDTAADHE